MNRTLAVALTALALGAALMGCSTDTNRASLGQVVLRLTDSPGDFEAVNLVVTGVTIHRGDEETGQWEVLSDVTTTYDLLTLRNGVFATLAKAEIPAGHYTQIRLKIGEGSNVVADGAAHPLEIPSGMQSGYKLVGEFDVPAGGLLELTLDFDAARSIVVTGNGRYKLKPTVRVIPTTLAGAIMGRIAPGSVETSVFAIMATDTLQSTEAASDGAFTLGSLGAGTYSVAIHPSHEFRDTTLTGVVVTAGATTDVGEVQLTSN